ncbi:MAG: homocysteine S-methyltransferase family protein [Dehalococcoidia bacterium]
MESLQSRIEADEIIIMDGGTGTEIQRRGVPVDRKTWSGAPTLTHPDVIRAIHEDYIRAGAEIVITNTFSTDRATLEQAGLGDRTAEANQVAVRLAKEARENVPSDRPVVIAGSMSTFQPQMDPTEIPSYEAALADYREQAQLLAEAGVDLIVAEMIIRTLDARAAVEATLETGLPIWVGYSTVEHNGSQVLGLHGRAGNEGIREAVDSVKSMGVSALFSMHSLPEDTGPALKVLKQNTSMPIGAYAHTVRATAEELESVEWNKLRPTVYSENAPATEEYLRFAQEWVGLGAQIIGGCCRTTPDHIKALKEGLLAKMPG